MGEVSHAAISVTLSEPRGRFSPELGGLSTGVGGLGAHRGTGSPVCLEPKGQELPSVALQHDLEE